jgi:hypothetical protein
MTETRKTLAILAARWPEATLIIGLYALADVSYSLFNLEEPDLANILSVFFVLVLAVISMMLNFGFLRTVHLEGVKKQMPIDLVRTGKHFFWRMVGFGLIYVGPYLGLGWIVFSIIRSFTSIETSFLESAEANPLIYSLCLAGSSLILIKISLFVQALIIVLDCGISKSFASLRECRLSEAKELVVLFCLSAALPLAWAYLRVPVNPETISQYILRIVTNVLRQVFELAVAVTAVRFVGSLDLVYDSGMTDSDSENIIKNEE